MAAKELQLTAICAKGVLTVDELCIYANLSKSYVYQLIWRKKIPHYKGGGGKRVYFKRAEVDAWMCAKRVATVDELETDAAKYCVTNQRGGAK